MAISSNGENMAVARKRALAEFVSSAVFGAALFSSGVYDPVVIKPQMTFSSNVMITVMMGGSAMSAVIQDIQDRLGYLPKKYNPPVNLGYFRYDGNVVGGALIGLGMALTGSCPGTSLVQAGVGMTSGILVVAGGILGGIAYLHAQPRFERMQDPAIITSPPRSPRFRRRRSSSKSTKASDMSRALGVSPFILLLIWVPMCLMVMQLAVADDHTLENVPASGLLRPEQGGMLIGLAQFVTIVLAGHTLGASGGYEDLSRWLRQKLLRFSRSTSTTAARATPLLTSSVVFSAGVIAAASIISRVVGKAKAIDINILAATPFHEAAMSLIGGAVMVFGARLAKGCTSGHGISGLARFSLPSLVTTAAMFGTGIITANVLGI